MFGEISLLAAMCDPVKGARSGAMLQRFSGTASGEGWTTVDALPVLSNPVKEQFTRPEFGLPGAFRLKRGEICTRPRRDLRVFLGGLSRGADASERKTVKWLRRFLPVHSSEAATPPTGARDVRRSLGDGRGSLVESTSRQLPAAQVPLNRLHSGAEPR
jgi:hypothetical protein